jgi:hypothetical protein
MMLFMNPESPEQPDYTYLESASLEVAEEGAPTPENKPPESRRFNFKKKRRPLLVLVIVLVLIGLSIAGLVYVQKLSQKSQQPPTVTINTQSLDNGTLNQLTDNLNGDIKEQLTISPNTIFKNNAVIQGSAQVIKDLSVAGKADILGTTTVRDGLTVGKSLTVGTNLNVNGLVTAASLNVGSIAISSINISGNLVFGGHLVPNGSTPNARTSTAAGGGSVVINGNDTSGTITIKTGGGGLSGEMAIINFRSAFSTTPKVQLTPVSSAGSSLNYYATKTTGFFTVNTSNATSPNTTYIFDYLITQ